MSGNAAENVEGSTGTKKPRILGPIKAEGGPLPTWVYSVWRQHRDREERFSRCIRLSMMGLSIVKDLPELMSALEMNQDDKEFHSSAESDSKFVQREIEDGFPILTEHMVISAWTSLEATIRELVAAWIGNRPEAMEAEAVQKLRVKIGEYESLAGDEKAMYIVEKLEQELSAPLKVGINRFQSLLEVFKLDCEVSDHIRQTMFELSQIRNNLVHRMGIVDRRLFEACPWLHLEIGSRLKVSRKQVSEFLNASCAYTTLVIVRFSERLGIKLPAKVKELLLRPEDELRELSATEPIRLEETNASEAAAQG